MISVIDGKTSAGLPAQLGGATAAVHAALAAAFPHRTGMSSQRRSPAALPAQGLTTESLLAEELLTEGPMTGGFGD
ncbi:hypothetical protein Kisp01_46240 [Kineosporia sp. NBRC 101677]|nr:hypothetical protein Kisp01_46240 [Kineosporia sp. NBRC 101677]